MLTFDKDSSFRAHAARSLLGSFASCLMTLSLMACSGGTGAPGPSGGAAGAGAAHAGSGGAPSSGGARASGGWSNPSAGAVGSGLGGASSSGAGTTGRGGSASGGAGAVSGAGASGATASGGSPGAPGGNGGALGLGGAPSGGTTGTSLGGAGPTAGGSSAAGGASSHVRDHCVEGYDPDPADATMVDGPAQYVKNNQIDLTVQQGVLDWLSSHKWEAAHFEWHSVRRCTAGTSQSKINVCSHKDMIPTDQECKSDGDGFQFLVMHRHMIQSLRQLFPTHTEQFEGFKHFPQSAEDVPEQWRADWSSFSAQDLANAKIADEIDKPENLAKFPTEGAFGRWLQCQAPTYSGLHGDLHFKWVRPNNTDHGLGNQETNIDNYMFWKLHGWIDNVWEKYRIAKGLAPTEQNLKDELVNQCREMDALAQLIDPSVETQQPDPGTLPPETGVFHTQVRPIFESQTNKCSGCHGPSGAEAGLTLGGEVTSASIVAKLVNAPSVHGGQFKLVAPGDPDHSWLYLKPAGLAANAGCTESATASCNTQVMPPDSSGHTTVSAADLKILHDWIQSGAPAPQ